MMTSRRPFRPDDTLDFERALNAEALASGLRSAFSTPTDTNTDAMDALVRASAKRQFIAPVRRHIVFPVRRWIGIAAALAFVMILAPRWGSTAPALAADLDGDGEVNVLDAFALARSLESGGRMLIAWDVNQDGVVDEGDVRAIAAQAVRIARPATGGGVSS